PTTTNETIRRQIYWTMLSGGAGHLYGNKYVVFFDDPTWKTHLTTTAEAQVTLSNSLFLPRRWYDLVPDQSHTVLTTGFGTYATTGDVLQTDYATAARTPDGTLAMIYVPTTRTIGVDMGTFSGPVTARWFDPTTGALTPLTGSAFANVGVTQLAVPGAHADAATDWVLLLEAVPAGPDTSPPSTPGGLVATAVSSSQVSLSWSPSTDNVSVAGYSIFRDGSPVGT